MDWEGEDEKTHRGFSTNETFGVYLSRRGPSVFRSAGACLYSWGRGWKRAGVEKERFVFIIRAVASSNGSEVAPAGMAVRGFARWLGD